MENLRSPFSAHRPELFKFQLMENKTIRRAVFAGSFDPFTAGHLDIVRRAAELFDEVIVLVAENSAKHPMFKTDVRVRLAKLAVKDILGVTVDSFDGLTVNYLKRISARYLVRGIRGASDIEWERDVAWTNRKLYPDCETVFLAACAEHLAVSSTVVRELLKNGADVSSFVPAGILENLLSEWSSAKCSE